MEKMWTVEVDGLQYKVELRKNKIFVNDEKMKKLKKVKGSNIVECGYIIPLGSKETVMYVTNNSIKNTDARFTIDGVDVSTNEPYEMAQTPKWLMVFLVLYIVDFFVCMGGAVGAVSNLLFYYAATRIAMDDKKSNTSRIIQNVLLWVGATALELFVALKLLASNNIIKGMCLPHPFLFIHLQIILLLQGLILLFLFQSLRKSIL